MNNILFKETIKGIPLVKFQNSCIINKMVDGSFYMNSLKTFRERYYSNYDEEIGDPQEGMLYINDGIMIVDKNDVKEIAPIQNEIIPTVNSNDFVFCMFGINPQYCSSFKFSDEQKKKWLDIYDTALLITDYAEFIKRINNTAQSEGIELSKGFVTYYDEKSGDIIPWVSSLQNGTENVAYYKRNRYVYQQEYRFTAKNRNAKSHLELNIGNISGISKVFPLKTFLDSEIFHIQNK